MVLSSNAKDWLVRDAKDDWRTIKSIAAHNQFDGYIGWVGYGNLGDEALYEAHRLLFPALNFMPFRVTKPTRLFSALTGRTIPLRAAVLGGGTLINQSEIWLRQTRYAINMGVPVFCMGTGVASHNFWKYHPGVHDTQRLYDWKDVLSKFVFVGVRGPESLSLLKAKGIDAEIVGDTAFSLPFSSAKSNRTFKKVVGINVGINAETAMWGNSQLFLLEIKKTVIKLLEDGFEVRLLPVWAKDVAVSLDVQQWVNSKRCRVIKAYDNYLMYADQVKKCDIFIGQKLHATIFATINNVPSIMLEYRPKCLDYMMSINMERYSVRTDKVKSEQLLALVYRLIDDRNSVRTELSVRANYFKDLQAKKAESINKLIT